jgi:hypothetical protein
MVLTLCIILGIGISLYIIGIDDDLDNPWKNL